MLAKTIMKISITKEQYKELITAVSVADAIFGVLGDMMADTDYKKRSSEMDKLEEYFLKYAKDFYCEELIQEEDGKKILNDEVYENSIFPIIEDYEEFVVQDRLANKLAWRDFRKEHSEKELAEMAKENRGYFGVELYDYEKKYWDEFEEYEFERLRIQDEN